MPKKFDFISPGVQLNEIDESVLSTPVSDAGPVLIGRARSGPAMQPVKIANYADFKAIFGEPVSGEGASDVDVWREGNVVGPTYAAYAAQAHLASRTTPITYVRLLGEGNSQVTSDTGMAGWNLGSAGAVSNTIASNVTAYGLFIFPSASHTDTTGSLGAVIYTNGAAVTLSGAVAGAASSLAYLNTSSAGVMVASHGSLANQFKIELHTSEPPAAGAASTPIVSKNIHFTNGTAGYIRDELNTNPQKLLGAKNFGIDNLTYFLGESYEQAVLDQSSGTTAAKQFGMILPLQRDGGFNMADRKMDRKASKTGWFINRKPGEEQLFRLISLHDGEWFQNNYSVFVEDLKLGDRLTPSSFSLVLKKVGQKAAVESFRNLNLDPSSDNYISKRIGDQSFSWNATDLKYDVRGLYVHKSDFFRIEVADAVADKTLDDTLALPMGFEGPLRPKRFKMQYGSSGPDAWSDGDGVSGVAATSILTFSSDTMETGATITFNAPDGAYVISTTATGGSDPTFTNKAADIDNTSDTNYLSYADAVATLLDTIPGYTVVDSGGGVVTILADSKGPHWTYTITEDGDDAGRLLIGAVTAGTDTDDVDYVSVIGGSSHPIHAAGNDSSLFVNVPASVIGAVVFPTFRLTVASSNRGGNYKARDYFGIRHHVGSSARRDASYADLTRALPGNYSNAIDQHQASVPSTHERAFRFHMEDIVSGSNTTEFYLSSGSYAAGDAENLSYFYDIKKLLVTKRIKQFRAAFWGGFDGLDIKESMPFSNKNLSSKTVLNSYAYNSMIKAFDMVADAETVEMDMLSVPGLTEANLTNKVLEIAEERGDALAVIDLADGFLPKWENNGSLSYGTITDTLNTLEGRQLNTSFGAAYYPWVVISDSNSDVVPIPPSVAAIGAMAKSAAASEVWFAPAGFNRGGIKNLGSNTSGLVVTHTIEHLTKDNRDDLYALNVNPIARFPATNQIVIFGQKTLQQTASALDRINVRRLLLYLKRRIGKIADTILFEPNVETTWNNFKSAADVVLADVQGKLGITDYKLVLDETTTTADLIDRNIMYAKIFIKPARAIEFIVVDFVVTRSGVEF